MTDNNSSYDLFISYSRKNKDAVLPIKDELERLGLTCWIDLTDIPCGTESFKKKVISGIKQTRIAFLFFLSAESQSSEYALREINFAKKRATKRVILIRFNDDQMTDEFYFDYQDADIIDWRIPEQKEKLLRDLKNWAGQRTDECHVKPKSPDEHQGAETTCGPEGVVEPCMVHEEDAERKARNGVKCKTIILPGGAEMEMIYCPPGEFMMGSPATERGRDDDETQHCVRLTKGFWLGKHPVTQQQWQSVMGTNPSKFKGNDLPVETVSWNDCQEFITRIGCGARLPTEAEWEYACRAGTIGKFGGSGILKELGWYFGNSCRYESVWYEEYSFFGKKLKETRVKRRQPQPVGKKEPNVWGLYDMHGNIWEWCMDWYGDYTACNAVDPKGEVLGDHRVLRGGCWNYKADYCRSSCRNHDAPDRRSHYYGFRLCCSK